MKKVDRQLNKTIRKIVAITDGMDKCKALEWLKELKNSIVFQIGVIEDDVRGIGVKATVAEHAEATLSRLQELTGVNPNRRKGKKKTKKAA